MPPSPAPRSSNGLRNGQAEADTRAAGAILYAGLTARWPRGAGPVGRSRRRRSSTAGCAAPSGPGRCPRRPRRRHRSGPRQASPPRRFRVHARRARSRASRRAGAHVRTAGRVNTPTPRAGCRASNGSRAVQPTQNRPGAPPGWPGTSWQRTSDLRGRAGRRAARRHGHETTTRRRLRDRIARLPTRRHRRRGIERSVDHPVVAHPTLIPAERARRTATRWPARSMATRTRRGRPAATSADPISAG